MARSELETALAEGGSVAQIKRLLAAELDRSAHELTLKRSGYEEPVTVAFAPGLLAVLPVPPAFRADPGAASARAISLVEGVLEIVGEARAGAHAGHLAVVAADEDPAVVGALFDDVMAGTDRLRACALVVPDGVLEVHDARPFVRAGQTTTVPSPHDDPDAARRVARRMLLTLRGKGKWGGYHSEVTNLARGFKDDWDLAERVGEALIAAGLLKEKPSVGQRHVSLNPRSKGDIDRLIDDGVVPEGLRLPGD